MPTDPNMLLGGTQDNGSPATATATTSTSWGNVLSGDGGYNAIDPNTGNWFASNPDTGSGTLNIQECSSGMNCTDSLFNVVVSSSNVGGDDGAFYFPYILDPQSTTSLLVGTCRVWSGPRSGGAFTLLSLNFDTLGTGTCAGTKSMWFARWRRADPANANGSQVIYATTDGPGPNDLSAPIGGNVWVTTNATAVSGTVSTFANVTLNGPGGNQHQSQPVSDFKRCDRYFGPHRQHCLRHGDGLSPAGRDMCGKPQMPGRAGLISPAPARMLFRILR